MKSNSFNFNSDNTFCISLLSNTERCVKMERRFKKLNLNQRRFETAPLRGAIVQTATGNLVEVSSSVMIEIFNGVNAHYGRIE